MVARFILLLCCFHNLCHSVETDEILAILPQLEELIHKGMETSHVPGLAIAVVHDNQVLLLKGYGVREAGRPEKVDIDTVFQLASVSKPITSTILASLVGKGSLKWDSKIVDLDPSFRLPDPWVTSQVTIKDLLCHRSGLPEHSGDLLEDLGFGRDTILSRLRFIAKTEPFRSVYAYTNFGFSEAAYATVKSATLSWNEVAQNELFKPLGMNSSSFSYLEFTQRENKASLHQIINNEPQALYTRDPDAQAPAGGASGSIKDVAQWMLLCLSKGQYKGKQLISKQAIEESQTPVIVSGFNRVEQRETFYGLGWGIFYDNFGNKILSHSGEFNLGTHTQVVLVPTLNLGIAVLINSSYNAIPEALTQSFLDLVMAGRVKEDWITKFNKLWLTFIQPPPQVFQKPKTPISPPLPLSNYNGKFSNPYFGEIEITKTQKGNLELVIGPKSIRFPLKHFNRDVFIFETTGENAIGETQILFSFDGNDKVRTLIIDALNIHDNGTFYP